MALVSLSSLSYADDGPQNTDPPLSAPNEVWTGEKSGVPNSTVDKALEKIPSIVNLIEFNVQSGSTEVRYVYKGRGHKKCFNRGLTADQVRETVRDEVGKAIQPLLTEIRQVRQDQWTIALVTWSNQGKQLDQEKKTGALIVNTVFGLALASLIIGGCWLLSHRNHHTSIDFGV